MIYFVQDSDSLAIKIGYAANPEERLATLQTANSSTLRLLAELPGGRADEAALHRRFAASRLVGEWFRPSPDLIEFLLDGARLLGQSGRDRDDTWEGFSLYRGDGFIFGPEGELYTRS